MSLFSEHDFNPKDHVYRSDAFQHIIDQVVAFADETPVRSLPPERGFAGPGVYLLYYAGPFEAYRSLSVVNSSGWTKPIYAGKAVPKGWRQSRVTGDGSPALYSRLSKHARSIRATENLDLDDFRCRFVILPGDESSMIAAVEAALIRHHKPLWNSFVDGFGNNDPGVNRYGQILAGWDSLHPGRAWEKKWHGQRPDRASLIQSIRDYLG